MKCYAIMWNDTTKHKAIISLSGGLGSAISAIIAHECRYNYAMVFADTLIEDEDLYAFIKQLSQRLNKPIHWLKDGRNPWEVFKDKRYIGNTRTAHCSDILKTKQVEAWLAVNASPHDELILGMDGSEIDRIERAQAKWFPRKVASLLTRHKVRRPEYEKYLKRYDLKKPRLYDYGFPHNNCGGMCVRSGLTQFATLLKHFPKRFAAHADAMEETMKAIGPTAKPFLRVTIAGKLTYITLTEFKRMYEANEIYVSPYDWGGCSCFVEA